MNNLLKTITNTVEEFLNEYLNKITMYKLLLWGLCGLATIAWLFSAVGTLPYGTFRPLVGLVIVMLVSFGSNLGLAKFYKVAINTESAVITGLLLFFIFQPPKNVNEALGLGLACVIAMASKYVITKSERHILNPAAFGAFVVSVTGILSSRWWIGRDTMFIFVLILAFLVVRKIHRFPMVISFAVSAFVVALLRSDASFGLALKDILLSFPIVFFGAFMLTEPSTTPPRRYQQITYGAVVGLLFSSGLSVSSISMTPEISLLIGNLLLFWAIPRIRQPLKLVSITEIGNTIFEYRFKPVVPISFKPGQYVEITLPLGKTDVRGNRRTFTIASSPTEEEVLFGVKQVEPKSSFKSVFSDLKKGDVVTANNVAGDFLLPINDRTKMVFIAGGIGITPFRSMLKYITDNRHSRQATLFYSVSDHKQIVYKDILNDAKEYGLKVIYVLTPPAGTEAPKSWKGEVGSIDLDMIQKHVLDYRKRQFYISGPDAMVQANKKLLRAAGIPKGQIKTDYFSGY